MTADQLKFKVNGVEKTGFEKPRRVMPAEIAVQQSCACTYDCAMSCRGGCSYDCTSQCAGNPSLQTTAQSTNATAERTDEASWIKSGIL